MIEDRFILETPGSKEGTYNKNVQVSLLTFIDLIQLEHCVLPLIGGTLVV